MTGSELQLWVTLRMTEAALMRCSQTSGHSPPSQAPPIWTLALLCPPSFLSGSFPHSPSSSLADGPPSPSQPFSRSLPSAPICIYVSTLDCVAADDWNRIRHANRLAVLRFMLRFESLSSFFFVFLFLWYWGLSLGWHTCQASPVPLSCVHIHRPSCFLFWHRASLSCPGYYWTHPIVCIDFELVILLLQLPM